MPFDPISFARTQKAVPRVTWRGLNHPAESVQMRRAVASLANSASGDAVTVVVTGDSTSLDIGQDAFTTFDTLYGMLIRKMTLENPGVTFRFLNRGISGATWGHLANVAVANFPTWYSAQAQPWIETYISPLGNGGTNKAPDLVVIMMGTNDNSSAGLVSPAAVLAKLANTTSFPITPDVWLCSSFGRTTDAAFSTADQNFGAVLTGSINRQIARGGHSRFAQAGNIYPRQIGLLDFSRLWAMSALGYDPAAQSLTAFDTAQLAPYQAMTALGTVGLNLPPCDGDFDFVATFPAQGSTLFAGRAMRLSISPPNFAGVRSLFLLQISGTSVSVAYQPGLGAVSYNGTSATVAAGSNVVIRCTVRGNSAFLSINGTTAWDAPIVRLHGPLQPKFYFAVNGTDNIVLNLTNYRAGRGLPYAVNLSNRQAWGENAVGVNGATGGNQVNHPSSLYVQQIVAPVLDGLSLSFA